ncbi:MAG: DUF2852 domain-containing protein [Rhodospirillaceae bacterium]|nr:DUF2852 domain-containing protein [Rhodospirillaceae bacterium]
MELAARLDDYGKPAWIAVMILGFVVFWPIGLALLAYLIWSGRMGCGRHRGPGRWHFEPADGDAEIRRHRRDTWFRGRRMRSSGNVAFDEYREETLRRLEDEQQEFKDFLERLRHAKDKSEFDQFMADRRRRPAQPDTGEAPVAEPQG